MRIHDRLRRMLETAGGFDETQHPRGQPENKGEFVPKRGGAQRSTKGPEGVSTKFQDLIKTASGRAQFVEWVEQWYMYGLPESRDELANVVFPPEYQKLPAGKVHRGVAVPAAMVKSLLKGKPVTLPDGAKVTSWTTDKRVAVNASKVGSDKTKGQLVLAKKPRDVIVYAPTLYKKNPWIAKLIADPEERAVFKETMLGESEVIVRNSPYWTTINPVDVVSVNGKPLKRTMETAGDERYLIPAIRYKGRVYKGEGMSHPQVAKKAKLQHQHQFSKDTEDGFVDHMGRFLNRRKAYLYARENNLMNRDYGAHWAETELDSDQLKPEAMRYPKREHTK